MRSARAAQRAQAAGMTCRRRACCCCRASSTSRAQRTRSTDSPQARRVRRKSAPGCTANCGLQREMRVAPCYTSSRDRYTRSTNESRTREIRPVAIQHEGLSRAALRRCVPGRRPKTDPSIGDRQPAAAGCRALLPVDDGRALQADLLPRGLPRSPSAPLPSQWIALGPPSRARPASTARTARAPWCPRRCGRGGPSPGADVAGVGPVPVQMWPGWAQSRRRCGRDGPSPGADVAGVGPVPVQMWPGWAQSRRRCGRGGPSPGADAAVEHARMTA